MTFCKACFVENDWPMQFLGNLQTLLDKKLTQVGVFGVKYSFYSTVKMCYKEEVYYIFLVLHTKAMYVRRTLVPINIFFSKTLV